MARELKMAGTSAASRHNQYNQLAISNGAFARGPSTSGFGRGMPGAWSYVVRGRVVRGRGAARGGAFGRWSGPPPKGRNAPSSDGFVSHSLSNPTRRAGVKQQRHKAQRTRRNQRVLPTRRHKRYLLCPY